MRTRLLLILTLALMASAALKGRQSSDGKTVHAVVVIQPDLGDTPVPFPNFVLHKPVRRPKVALVLSGGGARGVAAIGVFKAFEKHGLPIDLIVGTSMGSIMGGLYAAGYSTRDLEALVDSTKWDDVISFSDDAHRNEMFLDQKIASERSIIVLRFSGFEPILPTSISSGQRLLNYLNILSLQAIYHPHPSFDNLRIPFRSVTTDIVSGKRVVIDRGDLALAMRASITVPLLFSTVKKDSMELLDGGLISNIPVGVAKQWGADIVVAVDVTSPLRPANKLNAPWEIADQIMGITMQEANKRSLEQANVVIRPPLGSHLSSDFTGIDSMITLGEVSADSALSRLDSLLHDSPGNLSDRGSPREFKNPRIVFGGDLAGSRWAGTLLHYQARATVSERDLRALATDMYEGGEYESVRVEVDEQENSTLLDFKATPNPALSGVEFFGNQHIDTLKSAFANLVGKRINANETRKALEAILATYRGSGYSLARIRNAELNPSTGIAHVDIDEGTIYRMEIRGTNRTRDWVIWRELPFSEGNVFEISKAAEGIRNLYGTGLFKQVFMSIQQEGENAERSVVTINVIERSTDLIRIGLRIDSERNFQPSIDVRDENFMGVGAEWGVRLFGGSRNQSVVGEFKATRIFNTYLTANIKAYYTLRDVNAYSYEQTADPLNWDRIRTGEYREIRRGGSLSFGTQLERLGSVTVEGRLENHDVYNIFSQPIGNQSYKISSVKFGTTVDTQNKFPYPTDGVLMNFTYETALVKIADAVSFTKLSFDYQKYQTFFSRHTIRPKFVIGFADATLPIAEQFSLGGQQSFMGVREDDARGRQLIVASLEYIYQPPVKLFFDTYLKARYDIGSVWTTPEQIRLVDLLQGIGVGIAFDTPIGPAEFSLGRAFFTRKDIFDNPVSLGPFVAYFSIGYPL